MVLRPRENALAMRKRTKKRNPELTYRDVARLWETDGAKPMLRDNYPVILDVVAQDLKRFEIPTTVCDTLKRAGYQSTYVSRYDRAIRCDLTRAEEIRCLMTKMLPHIITRERRETLEEALARSRPTPRARRIPFHCPDELSI